MIEELLTKAGFDSKEIKVYLAALSLGAAPASIIAKKAGIVRSTSYGILESLVQKGLASKSERSGVLWFIVDNPGLLRNYIQAQKDSLSEVEKDLEKHLPALKNLQKEYGFKPEVEFFEGAKGVAAAFESVLPDIKRMAKANIFLLAHAQTDKLIEVWPDFPKYARNRAKTGIKIKMLVSNERENGSNPQMKELHENYYEARYVPEKYIYKAGTNILDEKVILFDFDQLVTIVIRNKPLAEMMRKLFEFTWDHAEKKQSNI